MHLFHSYNKPCDEYAVILFLPMRKLSPTVIQWFAPGHTSKNGRIWGKNQVDAFLMALKYFNGLSIIFPPTPPHAVLIPSLMPAFPISVPMV